MPIIMPNPCLYIYSVSIEKNSKIKDYGVKMSVKSITKSTPTTLSANLTNLLKHLYIFEKRPYPSFVVLQWFFHWGFIEFLANLAVINDVADICWVCRRYPIGMVSEKVYSISNCLQLQQRWSEIQFDDPLSLHLKGRNTLYFTISKTIQVWHISLNSNQRF